MSILEKGIKKVKKLLGRPEPEPEPEPLYNVLLRIDYSGLSPRVFDSELVPIERLVEIYGVAVAIAIQLTGFYIRFDDKTMRRGHIEGLETRKARIDLFQSFEDLHQLADIRVRRSEEIPLDSLHFHCDDGGGITRITEVGVEALRVY